jgi:probable rRNA maturation factor
MSRPTDLPQPSNSLITIEIDAAYAGLVARELLQRAAEAALAQSEASDAPLSAELTVVVTGDEQIRALNRAYLGEDSPTDVLSFPSADSSSPFVTAPEAEAYLGDVIISYPRAQAQAEAAGHPVEAELQLLVVHGVLHLLGHDHLEADEKARMWALQGEVLRHLGLSIVVDRES